jgi:hypothetical protein
MAHGRHSPSGVSDVSTERLANQSLQQYQSYLDASTPYTTYRWVGTGVLLFFFFLRIVFAQGWYIGTSSLNLVWCLHMREWLQLSRHESGESDRMTARTNR